MSLLAEIVCLGMLAAAMAAGAGFAPDVADALRSSKEIYVATTGFLGAGSWELEVSL